MDAICAPSCIRARIIDPPLQQLRLLADFQPSVSRQPDTEVLKGIEVRDLRQPVSFFTANLRSHLWPMTPARTRGRFNNCRLGKDDDISSKLCTNSSFFKTEKLTTSKHKTPFGSSHPL